MPRAPRSHLPGTVFHLTARTQGGERWFTDGLRDRIVEYAASSLAVSDAQLIAWAVMPNHLHIVLRQGDWRLGEVMHGLLHRTALLVQRAHGVRGHVFERRFTDTACHDPEHVSNSILYTHMNPVRAGLAAAPGDYPWTSHHAYVDDDGAPACMRGVLRTYAGLGVFAEHDGSAPTELRRAYRDAIAERLERDRVKGRDAADNHASAPLASRREGGAWSRHLTPLFPATSAHAARRVADRSIDMKEVARRALAEFDPDISLEEVRSACKRRPVVLARAEAVRRLDDAGARGRAIARYLRVSPQCVSNILVRQRSGAREG